MSGRGRVEEPVPATTAEGAWRDFYNDGDLHDGRIEAAFARHRPLIEAAIRAAGPDWETLYVEESERYVRLSNEMAAIRAAGATDDRLRFHPITGDPDFGLAPLSYRLDTLHDIAVGEGIRAAGTTERERAIEYAAHIIALASLPRRLGPGAQATRRYLLDLLDAHAALDQRGTR